MWAAGWPYLAEVPVGELSSTSTADMALFGVTTAVAAGSGVIPDLDHPSATGSEHLGMLSKLVAKIVGKSADGHRAGTHTLAFAALMAGLAVAADHWPGPGRIGATAWAAFCASVGLALLGPSLGFRVPVIADLVTALAVGGYVWVRFETIAPLLWLLAAGGVIVHIACDVVTKGGVPFLRPFTRRRFCLKLFSVGGAGEGFAGLIGYALLVWAVYSAVSVAVA